MLSVVLLAGLAQRAASAFASPPPASPTPSLDRWLKYGAILTPTEAFEKSAVQEPSVLFDADRNIWRMWYTAGWGVPQIAYAESPDGIHWTKLGPVLGAGAGGVETAACRVTVIQHAGLIYLYFVDGVGVGGEQMRLAISHDGIHFELRPEIVIGPGGWHVGPANSAVWIEDGRWRMLYEARAGVDGPWKLGYAESPDGVHWTEIAGPLDMGYGIAGGPAVMKRGDVYHVWHTGNRKSNVLPTEIYHSFSTDFIHWQSASTVPAIDRTLWWEVDQTADPSIVEHEGRWWMFYAGADNPAQQSVIGLALQDAPK